MCDTVCPSQALFFGTREQLASLRPQSVPTNVFRFAGQTITTRVQVLVPRAGAAPPLVDVTAAMAERPRGRAAKLPVLADGRRPAATPAGDAIDPFAEVEV